MAIIPQNAGRVERMIGYFTARDCAAGAIGPSDLAGKRPGVEPRHARLLVPRAASVIGAVSAVRAGSDERAACIRNRRSVSAGACVAQRGPRASAIFADDHVRAILVGFLIVASHSHTVIAPECDGEDPARGGVVTDWRVHNGPSLSPIGGAEHTSAIHAAGSEPRAPISIHCEAGAAGREGAFRFPCGRQAGRIDASPTRAAVLCT